MKKRKFVSKLLSSALAVSVAASLLPVSALAVTGSQVAADATYSASTSIAAAYSDAAQWQDEEEDDWADYSITVTLTVEDGVFTSIAVDDSDVPDASTSYFNKAATKSNGFVTLLTGSAATADTINSWDAVSGATCTSEAIRAAALSALASASEAVEEVVVPVLSDGSSFPTNVVLTEATESASEVIAQLASTVTYYDEEGNAVVVSISWSCSAFDTTAEAVNTFTWSADTSALGDYDISGITTSGSISVTNPEAEEEPQEEEAAYVYVLMNIPFEEFYSVIGAENVDGVDAISAATSSKYNYYNLAGASYNNGDADIDGVTYYVQLSEEDYAALTELGYTVVDETAEAIEVVSNRAAYEISGIDTLFACGDYAYAVVEEQTNYLTAEIVDGAVVLTGLVGTVQTVEGMTYDFTTDTTYGDYQLNLDTDLLAGYGIESSENVVLVTLNTSDGCIYALLPVEEYWIGYELAWSTGHTTTVHNSVVNYALYEGMEGKTITSVTYYTYDGIYEFVLSESLLVTPYAEGVTAELAKDESAITISGIPEDAENVTVSLSYTEGSGRTSTTVAVEASYEKGVLTPAEALAAGTTYNITITADNYAFETLSVTTAEAVEEESEETEETPETEETEETEETPETGETEETEETPETEETGQEVTEPEEEEEQEAEETASVNGLANLGGGWALYKDGVLAEDYTGLYQCDGSNNAVAGWYFVVDGCVDFSYTGLVKYNGYSNGKKTGVAGWYYVKNGHVDFTYTGLVKYTASSINGNGVSGWYYVENAHVDFSYTGVVSNSSGKWYVKNANVKFGVSGLITINGSLYIVKGGKVLF